MQPNNHITRILPIILSKHLVKKYFYENSLEFKWSYDLNKINKNKLFIHYKNGNSFSCTILHYIYH
jgi:hypothetical protein